MSYTSDTKFQRGKETCAYVFPNLIKFSPKYLKDGEVASLFLKGFIHEINEIEVSMLLKSHGFSDLIHITLDKEAFQLLESNNLSDFFIYSLLVSHLLSPYGYGCLIGIKENTLEW